MSAPFDLSAAIIHATLTGRAVAARTFLWRDELKPSTEEERDAFQAAFAEAYGLTLATIYQKATDEGADDDQATACCRACDEALKATIGGRLQ